MTRVDLSRIKGIFLVLIANLIWGTSAFLVDFFPNLDSISIVFARSLFGAIFISLSIPFFVKPLSRVLKAKAYLKELILSAITFIGTVGFMTAGVKYGSVSSTMFLLYTAPIFVVVFAKFILKEKVKSKDILPMMLASIGLVFIFGGSLSGEVKLGDIFGLLGGISWGMQIIVIKKIGRNLSGYVSSFWSILFALIILSPLADYQGIFKSNLILLIMYGVINNGVAAIAFFEGIRHTSAKQAGLLSLIDPIENSLLAFTFLNEIPTLGTFIGGVLIIISMIVQAVESKGS